MPLVWISLKKYGKFTAALFYVNKRLTVVTRHDTTFFECYLSLFAIFGRIFPPLVLFEVSNYFRRRRMFQLHK